MLHPAQTDLLHRSIGQHIPQDKTRQVKNVICEVEHYTDNHNKYGLIHRGNLLHKIKWWLTYNVLIHPNDLAYWCIENEITLWSDRRYCIDTAYSERPMMPVGKAVKHLQGMCKLDTGPHCVGVVAEEREREKGKRHLQGIMCQCEE